MKNFKITLIGLLFVGLLTSCSVPSDDAFLLSVKKTFPNSKIYVPHEGTNFRYVVIDSVGNVYKVQTGNSFDTEVTKVIILTEK